MANLGSRFRARREEQGCTLDDIAARTKISRRLLDDLERNDFAHWPASRVYRIGYLRAYAAAIGLDAAEMVAQFDAENGLPHRTAVMTPQHESRPERHHRRLPGVSLTLALAACVFGGLLIGRPLYLKSASPVVPPTPMMSRPQTETTSGPEGPHYVAPASAETTAVPTSGGIVASDAVEGELLIESEPAGTRVVVNGLARGTTPIRLQYLPVGSYTIRLVRDGYESQEISTTLTSERPVRSLSISLRERTP